MRFTDIATLLLIMTLAACGGPLSLLTGGGPNVAANVQAGKTNAQTIGQTNVTEQKLVRPQARSIEQSTGETRVRADSTGDIRVDEKDAPWLIIAFAIALLLDSPLRWPGQIAEAFRRKPSRKKST